MCETRLRCGEALAERSAAFRCRRPLRRPPSVAAADTRDVAGTVAEVKRCVDAGAEIVRITVQGKKEAAACMAIREALFKDRCARARSAAARTACLAPHVSFALRGPLAAIARAANGSRVRGRAGTTCRWWRTSTSSRRSP